MEASLYTMIIDGVTKVGFPIVIACWFMFRTDKRLDKNNDLIAALLNKIERDEDKGN